MNYIIINRMAIEITLRCNLACPQCDHHCDRREIPYVADSDMGMDQVERFIREVQDTESRIIRLSIGGGEPLVHPGFARIVGRLHRELVRRGHVARRRIRVITNGTLETPPEVKGLCIVKTLLPVGERGGEHRATWQAPRDTGQRMRTPKPGFKVGCNVPYRCGFVLNRWGYWPCGPGGAICRLFGLDGWVRYRLPVNPWVEWDVRRLYDEVCPLCQYSARCTLSQRECPEPGPSFARAFAEARRRWPEYGRV